MFDLSGWSEMGNQSDGRGNEPWQSGQTEYGRFAERVLPVLCLFRIARLAAQSLGAAEISPSAALAARDFIQAVHELDVTVRATGVYELSEVNVLENDTARMDTVCDLLNDVVERLRRLVTASAERIEHCKDRRAETLIAPLVEVLNRSLTR